MEGNYSIFLLKFPTTFFSQVTVLEQFVEIYKTNVFTNSILLIICFIMFIINIIQTQIVYLKQFTLLYPFICCVLYLSSEVGPSERIRSVWQRKENKKTVGSSLWIISVWEVRMENWDLNVSVYVVHCGRICSKKRGTSQDLHWWGGSLCGRCKWEKSAWPIRQTVQHDLFFRENYRARVMQVYCIWFRFVVFKELCYHYNVPCLFLIEPQNLGNKKKNFFNRSCDISYKIRNISTVFR